MHLLSLLPVYAALAAIPPLGAEQVYFPADELNAAIETSARESQLDLPPSVVQQLIPGGGPQLSGQWRLSWDDSVGHDLSPAPKTCDLKLHVVDGHVTGEFIGPVAGTERDAIFTGELHTSANGSVMVLQQREPGYVCTYQISWRTGGGVTAAVGTWADVNGSAGDFTLLKYQ